MKTKTLILVLIPILILAGLIFFFISRGDNSQIKKSGKLFNKNSPDSSQTETSANFNFEETSDLNIHNEKEFQTAIGNSDFVAKDYDFEVPCAEQKSTGLPDQNGDDYLHEERFEGMEHIVLFDHIVTRKMINVIIPEAENPAVNLCNINLTLINPETDESVTFYDIYNWVDDEGKPIFNTNKKVYQLWGFSEGKMEMPVDQIHAPTGEHLDHGHTTINVGLQGITKYQ